jgi:hypothetical protein
MRSNTIALRGPNQVIAAYKTNDMPAWAICNGKDVMFGCAAETMDEGEAFLRQTVYTLREGGSRGTFMLRCYELGASEKITNNTPASRSIPFLLWDDENEDPYRQGRSSYAREADEKIAQLERQIEELKAEIAEQQQDEKPEGIQGFIGSIIEDPYMKNVIMQAIAGFVQKVVPMGGSRQPAAVAGIESGTSGVLPSILAPGQPEKVQQAINILCTQDAQLGDHLMKLADIAIKNPGQFKVLLGMLTNF